MNLSSGIWIVMAVVITIAALAALRYPAKQLANQEATAQRSPCHQDLVCWGQKHERAAFDACDTAIARRVKALGREDDTEVKFEYFAWLDKDAGWLTYYGNLDKRVGKASTRFECDWDAVAAKVLNLRLVRERI